MAPYDVASKASYDVASKASYDVACKASYDVACNICQALGRGGDALVGAVRRQAVNKGVLTSTSQDVERKAAAEQLAANRKRYSRPHATPMPHS